MSSLSLLFLLVALTGPLQSFAKDPAHTAFAPGGISFEDDVIRLRTFRPGFDVAEVLSERFADVDAKVRAERFNDDIAKYAATFKGLTSGFSQNGEPSHTLRLLIEHRPSNEVIGTFVIHEYIRNQFEIGYALSMKYRRQGLTSRAVQLAIAKIRELRPDALIIACTCFSPQLNSPGRSIRFGFHRPKIKLRSGIDPPGRARR